MTPLAELIRRAWPVFLEAVRQGRTVTYTELASRGGPPLNRRHLHRQLLIPLSERCRRAGLPCLAALVVRQDTGRPGGGAGWAGPGDWADDLAACLAYRWPSRPDPRLLEPDPPARGARSASATSKSRHSGERSSP
jgi:hypothetical protein